MELDARDFSVGPVIEACCALVRERAMRQSLRLEAWVEPAGLTWRADERKFRQVALNLLSNAVKYTPRGGEVRIEAREEREALELSVSDTGVGIAPENQESIFGAFHQLPGESGAARQEGTGLGLALSRRLVELHGGTLTVTSALGEGATFTARFPRRPGRG